MATSKRSRTRSATACPALRPPGRDAAATIADVVADLTTKQARLSALIDAADDDDTGNLAKLFSIYSQTASRIGRLLRDQRALSGEAADGISGAIAQALDELSSELGTPL
jgi:hypothetical protein